MTVPELETWLRVRLTAPLPGAEAQFRFAPLPIRKGWRPEQQPDTARRAAALVIFYPGADGAATLALTERHSALPQHAGQISLPGGRIDAGETPVEAALREAHEEIGVNPADVRIVGQLSTLWVIVSNHLLWTFVGISDRRPEFRLAPGEVEALIEAPLDQLLDAGRLGWSRHTREGIVVDYPHFDVLGHEVWGATAMVLGELVSMFEPAFAPPARPGSSG